MIREEHSTGEEHNGALTFTSPRVGRRPSGSSSEEHRRIWFQEGVIESRQRRGRPAGPPPCVRHSGESD